MKILFDQGTPAPLRSFLGGHEVATAYERGWQTLHNGVLLSAAEAEGFELLIATDQNLQHQQNLSGRKLAILVVSTTNWRRIRSHAAVVVDAVNRISPGSFVEVSIPAP